MFEAPPSSFIYPAMRTTSCWKLPHVFRSREKIQQRVGVKQMSRDFPSIPHETPAAAAATSWNKPIFKKTQQQVQKSPNNNVIMLFRKLGWIIRTFLATWKFQLNKSRCHKVIKLEIFTFYCCNLFLAECLSNYATTVKTSVVYCSDEAELK